MPDTREALSLYSLLQKYNELGTEIETLTSSVSGTTTSLTEQLSNLSTSITNVTNELESLSSSVNNATISGADESILNCTYDGKDLTTAFADEISEYSGDVWAWIKGRIDAADYTGLRIGDYIPVTVNGYSMNAQIMGIDTYYGYYYGATLHHIDFITKELYYDHVQWNTTNTNNGTSSQAVPWLASNLYSVMNNTWLGYLPTELQNVIADKNIYLEQRYSSSGSLTTPSGCTYVSMGKLWVPLAIEIFGPSIYTAAYHSEHIAVQYPLFVGSYKNIFKQRVGTSDWYHWWTASPYVGNSTSVCDVVAYAGLSYNGASYSWGAPLCFRIA